MQKLIVILIFLCAMTIETSTPLFGAEEPHPPNPQLDSARPELSTPPASVPQRSRVDQHTPTAPSAQKEQEQKEKYCAKDLAAVNCEPPPGSPLSASPLASQTLSPAAVAESRL